MMDCPRALITEWNLGKFPDSMEFQSWKVNFRTVVCLRTADPQITMFWIKEEIAESIDELMTARWITGKLFFFFDYDMLDAMIASALKKLFNTQSKFRKRVFVEELRNMTDSLRGRQIAYMVYEYFRATGACETVQGLADLVSANATLVSVFAKRVPAGRLVIPRTWIRNKVVAKGMGSTRHV